MHLLWILLACDRVDERAEACLSSRAAEAETWAVAEARANDLLAAVDTAIATHEIDVDTARDLTQAAAFAFEDARAPMNKLLHDLERRCTGILGCFEEARQQAQAASRGEAVDPHPRLVDLVTRLGNAYREAREKEQQRVEANFALSSVQDLERRAKQHREDLLRWQWKVGDLRAAAVRGDRTIGQSFSQLDTLGKELWPNNPPTEVAVAMAARAATQAACDGVELPAD